MDAYYDALELEAKKAGETPKKIRRFDGGGWFNPHAAGGIYSSDFQARMGPAKFLAQRGDFQQYLRDTGLTYTDANGKRHAYMPGQGTTGEEYLEFRNLYRDFIKDPSLLNADQLARFELLRDTRMTDVLDPTVEQVIDQTAIKNFLKKGTISANSYNEIVDWVQARIKSQSRETKLAQLNEVEANPLSTIYEREAAERAYKKALESPVQRTAFNKKKTGTEAARLTSAESNELIGLMSDPEFDQGLRAMKDSLSYQRKKDFVNPAFLSTVVPDPGLQLESIKNYINAFRDFSTEGGIIKRVFKDSGYDAQRVKQNKDLLYTDPHIRYRVQSELNDLEQGILSGEWLFPGRADMLLATATQYDVFGKVAEDLSGRKIEDVIADPNTTKEQREAAITAAKLKLKKGEVWAPSLNNQGNVVFTRSPYAPDASFFATPSKGDKKAYARYGLSPTSAMISVEDMYALNTGDFDGDFIWAYNILKGTKDFQAWTEKRNQLAHDRAVSREHDADIKNLDRNTDSWKNEPIDHDPRSAARAHLKSLNQQGPIGVGFKAVEAWRMKKMLEQARSEVDEYGNAEYAWGIDALKHAGLEEIAQSDVVKEAIRQRQPFDRLTKALFEEVDSEEFGKTDIFKYGLPTFIDPLATHTVGLGKVLRQAQISSYGQKIRDAFNLNFDARYGEKTNKTNAERDLARWYKDLYTRKLTGGGEISTDEDIAAGTEYISALESEIRSWQKNGGDKARIQEMEDMVTHAKNALEIENQIGLTTSNMDSMERFYRTYGWVNPVKQFGLTTKLESDVSAAVFEAKLAKDRQDYLDSIYPDIDKRISETTGTGVTDEQRQNYIDRVYTARKHTGFNFSNAKHFMKEAYTTTPISYYKLGEYRDTDYEQETPITGTQKFQWRENKEKGGYEGWLNGQWQEFATLKEYNEAYRAAPEHYQTTVKPEEVSPIKSKPGYTQTVDFTGQDQREEQQAIARSILTGHQDRKPISIDAIVGSAAHEYMDTYVDEMVIADTKKTKEQARNDAQKKFESHLFGENGVLSDAQREEQMRAGIIFEKQKNGLIQARFRTADEMSDEYKSMVLTEDDSEYADRLKAVNYKLRQASRIISDSGVAESSMDKVVQAVLDPIIDQTNEMLENENLNYNRTAIEALILDENKNIKDNWKDIVKKEIVRQQKFAKEESIRQQEIAKVGSGENSVLYFEIRQANIPENPLLWLKERK